MLITQPNLLTNNPIRIAATDDAPTVDVDGGLLPAGRELVRDNGSHSYWTGAEWKAVSEFQKLCQVADLLMELRDTLAPRE